MKLIWSSALVLALAGCAPASHDANATDSNNAATTTTTQTAAAAVTTAQQGVPPPQTKAADEERPMSYYKDKVAELHTSSGEIDIRFFPDVAPNHVKNFIDLAEKGFYNGSKFHRVIPGFMIQGGDPNTISGPTSSWGTGGSGKYLQAEFNNIHHGRGIVSMARANDPNSASSQFFIVVADAGFLDKQYTVFGQVTKGMDVADKIVNAPRNSMDRPNEPTTIDRIVVREARDDEKGPTPQ